LLLRQRRQRICGWISDLTFSSLLLRLLIYEDAYEFLKSFSSLLLRPKRTGVE